MHRWAATISIVLLLASAPATALTDEEIFRELRFNLINPGARSMGVGGAFLSVADDATAAKANPAGLSFFSRAEFFAELRAIDNGARSSSSSQSVLSVETFAASGTDVEDFVGPSFISYVSQPFWDKFVTLGFSLQDLLNINNRTQSTFKVTSETTPGVAQIFGAGEIELKIRNFNVSAGFRVMENFGLGLTLTYATMDANSRVLNSFIDTDGILTPDAQPVLEETDDLLTTIDDTDSELTYSVGLLYRADSQRWGAGAVYRRGSQFRVTQTVTPLQIDEASGNAFDLGGVGARFASGQVTNQLNLPNSYGIGANGWPIADRINLTLNIERILYSSLVDGYVSGINALTEPDAVFKIDDATEVRFGGEYVFSKTTPIITVRGGAYSESNATISAESTGTDALGSSESFQEGDTIYHGTVGMGLNWSSVKLDFAADFSDLDNEFLVSFIYRFGK